MNIGLLLVGALVTFYFITALNTSVLMLSPEGNLALHHLVVKYV